ncbi:hypothetical protein GCM10010517_59350 [Streptosporangium fragile]|uniref:DUF2357 domain-containing protein n=1 Tax=Streptosporangium fragile TaxID=46186 RepID=A0ABP6IKZ0_9ACTN
MSAPDLLMSSSVIAVAHALRRTSSVAGWLRENVFMPDTKNRSGLNALDKAIIEDWRALKTVCWRPHDRLETRPEIVRAARARRVPPAGLMRLASHTADWAGVEHGRIHPHRLLSLNFAENLDFYENRVAAQLVDRLRAYLTARIDELDNLARSMADLDQYRYHDALGRAQSWRKTDRLAHLVAAAVASTEGQAVVVQETVATLRTARDRVLGLQSSPAYRHASRRLRVPLRLLRTNLFANDDNYHRVGTLWDQWLVRHEAERDLRKAADAEFSSCYGLYVATLAVRACQVLGFSPVDPSAPFPRSGSGIDLSDSSRTITCHLEPDGIRMSMDGRILVHVKAVQESLSAHSSAAAAQEAVNQLYAALGDDGPVIVAYPGLRHERENLPQSLRRALHSSGPSRGSPASLIGVVPVTPLEIEGIERLARALRWVVHGFPMRDEYPPAQLAGRTPTAEDLREADGGRAQHILRCPLCGAANAKFSARGGDTFHCRCGDCEGTWGTRLCGRCSRRYPVLWPKNAKATGDDGDQLDLAFGADLLAMPCTSPEAGTRFRCPWCD